MHYDQRVAVHVTVPSMYKLWSQTLLTAECHLEHYQESNCQGILAGIQFMKCVSNSLAALCTCSYIGLISFIRLCIVG